MAAISGVAGNKDARTGDAEAGIAPIFDKDRVQKEIDAQIKITAEFGKTAATAWGTYANQKFTDAVAAGDEETASCWAPSGACRAGGHALIGGLAGGTAGAVGAATSSLTAPAFLSLLSELGVPDGMAEGLTAAYAAGMGALMGGSAGAGSALNEAVNNSAMAARMILGMIELGGAGVAQMCLKSPRCIGVVSAAALQAIIEASGNSGDGPSMGDVNPGVFGGSEAGLPADTYGTPPNGSSPPPEGENSKPEVKTTVRHQGTPNEVTVYETQGQQVQINTGHGIGRTHATGNFTSTGLTKAEIESGILSDVVLNSSKLPTSPINVPIRSTSINGVNVGYRAYIGPGNRIFVSTYFPL